MWKGIYACMGIIWRAVVVQIPMVEPPQVKTAVTSEPESRITNITRKKISGRHNSGKKLIWSMAYIWEGIWDWGCCCGTVAKPGTRLIVSNGFSSGSKITLLPPEVAANPTEVGEIVSHSCCQCTNKYNCHRWGSCSCSNFKTHWKATTIE